MGAVVRFPARPLGPPVTSTEAARASCTTGFEELGIEKIVADVLPGKVQSMRVLEKCGFERAADLEDGRAFFVLTR